jgi:RNA polymerase sigma factor (TIGR02999 family)
MAEEITSLLKKLNQGESSALDTLIPMVYKELHRIAQGYLRREAPGNTLQPTSLIHETYLRMVGKNHPEYAGRAHFFGVAARVMRQILVDHARSRQAAKRQAGQRLWITDVVEVAPERSPAILAVNEALDRLAVEDQPKAQMVEMRFFGGMTAEEIAACMHLPVHTVNRQLRLAQAWLRKEVSDEG